MAVGVLDPRKGIVWQDDGSSLTPEQIEQLQALEVRRRMGGVDTSPVNHWSQGAARVVDALGGVLRERRLANAASENQAYNAQQAAPLIEALSGSSPVASAATSGVSQELAATSPNVSPEIRSGIIETANALGIDPVDLGTAISYETAGTFDPTKAGPTTQWGQHKGLIQFGEPQAQQYGVDWNNPVGSQLGPNGAVANYLRSTGVKPGMGLMDIYSAINAGGVGRYGASDANNGGAPGTVADKVNQQMGGHRAKALALLGDYGNAGNPEVAASYAGRLGAPFQPQTASQAIETAAPSSGYVGPVVSVQPQAMAPELPAPTTINPAPPIASVPQQVAQAQPQTNPAAIAQALRVMADPRANEGTRRVAQALIQQEQQKQQFAQEQAVWQQRQEYERAQQASDPLRQLQIQQAQINLEKARNPQQEIPDAVQSLRLRAQEAGLQPGTPEYQNFFITQGVRPPSTISAPPSGYRYDYDANGNPVSVSPIPGSPPALEAEERKRVLGNQQSGRETSTDVITNAAKLAREAVNAPGLPSTGTIGNLLSGLPETNASELRRQVSVLTSNATVENLNAMRQASPTGGALGSVTEKEGAMLAAKSGALDPNSPNFMRDLDDYEKTLLRIVHGQEKGDEIYRQTRNSGNADIEAAKQAIARGADRGAVIKRLQDAGISTEGL